jgi:hypothetical protein
VLVDEQTPEAFAAAIARFETLHLSADVCRRHAEQFSEARFRDELRGAVWSAYAGAGRLSTASVIARKVPA